MNKIVVICLLLVAVTGFSQKKNVKAPVPEEKPLLWKEDLFGDLKFRSIGPAFMAGRIADIAIHPRYEKSDFIFGATAKTASIFILS